MLIPEWANIHRKNPKAVLVIAGPDYQGYENFVRGLVDKFNVSDSVSFVGEVNAEHKWAIYKKASFEPFLIMVLFNKTGGFRPPSVHPFGGF